MSLVEALGHRIRDPLGRFPLFRTADLDEARDRVAEIYCPHELRIDASRQRRGDTFMSHVPLGAVSLNRLRYGASVSLDAGCLDSFLLVMMPLRGNARISCGSQSIVSNPRLASVVSPTLPLSETIEAGCDQVMVRIERELLERTCAQHLGHPLRQPLHFELGLDMCSSAARHWINMVCYLLNECETATPLLQSPLLRAQFEQVVVTSLLLTQPHNQSAALRQPGRAIAPAHVKRVEEYIETHAEQPLTVAALAAHAGVSSSALHAGFRDFRDTTPMAHLKAVRLRRVREELAATDPARASVTEVALRWGFRHLGHFSAGYRQAFGETPSETLRRQRA